MLKLEDLIVGDLCLEEFYKGDIVFLFVKYVVYVEVDNDVEDEDGEFDDFLGFCGGCGYSFRFFFVVFYFLGFFVCNRCL